jgi:hypothetical protein
LPQCTSSLYDFLAEKGIFCGRSGLPVLDECCSEPAGFVPLSLEEEVIAALCNGNAPEAARILRQMKHASGLLLDNLASMLDGDSSSDPTWPVRLVFTAWGRGRPMRQGKVQPSSTDTEVIAALGGQSASAAAQVFRQVVGVGQLGLAALADMLDGDAAHKPELKQLYPRRLKIVTHALPGRPRRGERRSLTAKPNRLRKSDKKTKAWEVMIAGRVKRARDRGASRKEAIEEARMARPFDDHSARKYAFPSYQAVEKAYDGIYGRNRRRTSKAAPPAEVEE